MIKNKNNNTPIYMISIMLIVAVTMLLCYYIHFLTKISFFLYISIISLTIVAHFLVMYISAPIVFMIFRKKFNYNSFWFRPKKFEKVIFDKIRIKHWKTKVPVYNKNEYSLQSHSSEEIIMNMCHAEIVHEVIILTSYLPILMAFFISHYGILVVTSFFFSCFHLMFVLIQRYNRPRVIRLCEKINS